MEFNSFLFFFVRCFIVKLKNKKVKVSEKTCLLLLKYGFNVLYFFYFVKGPWVFLKALSNKMDDDDDDDYYYVSKGILVSDDNTA